MIFKLYKILASSSETLAQFTDGFKKGPKGIAKSIVLILLGIYLVTVLSGMYVLFMISAYKVLAASGQTALMPFISLIPAVSMILFFGFTSVAASYYTGGGEEQFLTMPFTPAQFFGAKFCMAYVTDAIVALVLFAISSFVYGYNEGLLTNPLFYLGFIVSGLSFSIVSVFLIYFVFIVLLFFFPFLRRKKLLTAIATVCIIVFAAGYGMLNSLLTSLMSQSSFALEKVSGVIEKISDAGAKLTVLKFFSEALNGKIIPILILAAITAVIVFVLIPLFGKMYVQTLNGFSDVRTKKISSEKAEEVIKKDVRSVSIFQAVLVRDIRNVLREPAFFTNGPLFVFLFPVIFLVSGGIGFAASGEGISELINAIQLKLMEVPADSISNIKFYITAGAIAYTIFTGTFANIAITSITREGKSIFDLKAMPIRKDLIFKAKFWHAMIYIGLSAVTAIILINAGLTIVEFPLYLKDILLMDLMILIGAGTISLPLIFIDMLIDTANPKMNWENPTAAVKQNLNVLWSMLLSMFVIVILIGLVFVLPKKLFSILIIGAVFGLISAPIGSGYFKYAGKKYEKL